MKNRLDVLVVIVVLGAVTFFTATTIAALRLDVETVGVKRSEIVPGYPRDVDFGNGHTFHVANRPQRIVAASARLIDFVAALVPPERIAGFAVQAVEYTTFDQNADQYLARPSFRDYYAEPVMALEPDLVLADPWQSIDTRVRLEAAGIPVLVLPDAVTIDEMIARLELLGRILGAEVRASEVTADLRMRVRALAERAAGRPNLRVLSYSNFGSQGYSAGSRTTIDEILRMAGLENVLTSRGIEGHVTITFEQLIDFDPDAIVLSEPLNAPTGHTGDRGGASETLLLTEESLAELRAVKQRRFLALPAGLFASGSQGIVAAAEWLAREVERMHQREAGEAR